MKNDASLNLFSPPPRHRCKLIPMGKTAPSPTMWRQCALTCLCLKKITPSVIQTNPPDFSPPPYMTHTHSHPSLGRLGPTYRLSPATSGTPTASLVDVPPGDDVLLANEFLQLKICGATGLWARPRLGIGIWCPMYWTFASCLVSTTVCNIFIPSAAFPVSRFLHPCDLNWGFYPVESAHT